MYNEAHEMYDYVIVEAGAAAEPLAARLSEDPACQVLLVGARLCRHGG